MNWESFKSWWANLFKEIGEWFTLKDSDGLNPLSRLIIAICLLIIGRFLIKFLMRFLRKVSGVKTKVEVDISVKTFTLSLVNVCLNLALAIFVLLVLKVDFSSLSSILSAGTVAIGLSLQDLISAFASGIVLLRSKHFKSGDYIQVNHSDGSCEGIVSSVGLIATTLETANNQHVVIPNNKMVQGVITNYSTNPTRRIIFEIAVDYHTDLAKCKALIFQVIENTPNVLKEPKPNIFVSDISYNCYKLSIRCYSRTGDYWDSIFSIKEGILLSFQANGIKIPYQKVIVENSDVKH